MINYFKSQELFEKYFFFLIIEYNFEISRLEKHNYGFKIEYLKNNLRLHLFYDFRDNFFYFSFINGISTLYPNDSDFVNIKTFYDVFLTYKPSLKLKDIQPSKDNFEIALQLNAMLLKDNIKSIINNLYA